jgi:hypothetical protein
MTVSQGNSGSQSGNKKVLAALLLLIPMAIFAITPIYNLKGPTLFGLSFFYWFEILWLVVSAVLYFIAARLLNSMESDDN